MGNLSHTDHGNTYIPDDQRLRLEKKLGIYRRDLMEAVTEKIIPEPYKWVYVDLKGNWLGLRVEPEDKERSEAFKDAVPKTERWYNRLERKWMFRTEHGALLFDLLKVLCPTHTLIVEEDSDSLIRTLLMGPGDLGGEKISIPGHPQGRVLGMLKTLSGEGQ